MKKIIAILLALTLVFSLAACGGGEKEEAAPAAEAKTIKIAHWYADTHPQHLSLMKFKELVEERSNGTLKVEIYPNSQLGSEDVFDDSVAQGTIEMASAGTLIQKFVPKIAVTEAPFLFEGWEDAQAILTGEIGQKITEELVAAADIKCLAITVNGFRQFSSNKTMATIEDFKGQRLRTPNIPHFIAMAEGLGANAVPMAMSEIFPAIEGKVVDGQENPYPTIFTSSFYEVQDYVLESNHMFSPNFWIMNNTFYEGLTDEEKAAVDSSIQEAAEYNWQISKEANDEAKQKIMDAGVNVIVPDEAYKQKLRDSQAAVYEFFYAEKEGSKEIVDMIREYQAAN